MGFALFEYAVSIFEGFLLVLFVHDYCGRRRGSRVDFLLLLTFQIFFSAAIIALNHFVAFEGVGVLVFALILFLYARIALDGSMLQHFFASVFAILCTVLVAGPIMPVTALLAGMPLAQIYGEYGIARCIGVLATKVLEFLILRFAASPRKKTDRVLLSGGEWCQVFFVSGLSIVLISEALNLQLGALAQVEAAVSPSIVTIIVGILIFNLYYIYIVFNKDRYNRIALENSQLKQQNAFQVKYAESVQAQHQALRGVKHDIKNVLSAIEVLLSEGNTEAAIELIHTQEKSLSCFCTFIETENDALNAIVNYKLTQAAQNAIQTSCIVTTACKEIPSLDLCNLLGNLLDNAIEATAKIDAEEKQIHLQIMQSENKTVLSVKNSIAQSVLAENRALKTTKADASCHGFGMQTVRDIVEKNVGVLDIFEENGFFCVQITFFS